MGSLIQEQYDSAIRENESLYRAVKELETELAKYKDCAVIGGDGEPVGIGDIVYTLRLDNVCTFVVGRIRRTSCDVDATGKERIVSSYSNQFETLNSDCFSTPEAAKGGEDNGK